MTGVQTCALPIYLGWGERQAKDPREVTLKLRLKMPNAAEARQVIADMEKAKSDSGSTWGEKGRPAADFSLLRFPVYRPLLAEHGNRDAIAGLAEDPALDATRVLLRLVEAARGGGPGVAEYFPTGWGPLPGQGGALLPRARAPRRAEFIPAEHGGTCSFEDPVPG